MLGQPIHQEATNRAPHASDRKTTDQARQLDWPTFVISLVPGNSYFPWLFTTHKHRPFDNFAGMGQSETLEFCLGLDEQRWTKQRITSVISGRNKRGSTIAVGASVTTYNIYCPMTAR